MRVMVTGGAGFIGSHVVEAFLGAGHAVSVLDNLSSGRRQNLDPRALLVEMDLCDPGLAALLAELRPELICHHAAQVSVARSLREPRFDAEVNLLGSLALLDAAVAAGTRKLIYVSSAAVYGEPAKLPVTEDQPLRPLSPYGLSKMAVEAYLPHYADRHGIDYSILRYANVYGPRQDPHGEAGVVAIFAERMLAGRSCSIFGSGDQARDFIHVADCARANLLLAGAAGGRATLNLGSGRLCTVIALHAAMARATGSDRPARFAPAREGEIHSLSLDPSRAAALLGWRAERGLQEGLDQTIAWFRDQAPAPADAIG
jgi:UDP-glucose 4-epimerase